MTPGVTEAPASNPLVLVTGSSDGIGKETACQLAEKGARVILHGRTPERLSVASRDVDRRSGTWPAGEELADFSTLAGVRQFAERVRDQFPRLDVLINNAGVFMRDRVMTADGFETTFAVDHLGAVPADPPAAAVAAGKPAAAHPVRQLGGPHERPPGLGQPAGRKAV